MTNTDSLVCTVDAMRASGRLEPIDEALVAAATNLAAAVDAEPTNASLWREYRSMLAMLLEVERADDESFFGLLERLQAPLRDTPDAGSSQ